MLPSTLTVFIILETSLINAKYGLQFKELLGRTSIATVRLHSSHSVVCIHYVINHNVFQASAIVGCQLTRPSILRTDATVSTTTCVTQCVKAGRSFECRVLFASCGVRKATHAPSETKRA